jgi:hypothetical protein
VSDAGREASDERRELESEFELALIDVLEQDYDLGVRLPDDAWNRRRSDVATLRFKYRWEDGEPRAKVVVSIEGKRNSSNVMLLDASSTEAIERCAENCEALALNVFAWLEECREKVVVTRERKRGRRRRWDD